MNVLTPRNYAPASVSRYLLPAEKQVISVRMHPVVLAKSFFITIGVLILGAAVSSRLPSESPVQALVWLPGLAVVGWFVVRAVQWWVDWFTITEKRFILTTGIITKKVAMMPLTRVTDMSFRRSPAGRILGYGEFVLESAGQDQALRSVPYLPYPEQMYRRVCLWIFPERVEDVTPEEVEEEEQEAEDTAASS
ncbi:MAG: PH domain-containing protein [Streptosporangiales bacterium]|nr:PH domain-containing protein [Streptosporangiales bacterium]